MWLYFRFPLSFREVEELVLQRGVIVSYETVRRRCGRFGQACAAALRRRRPRPGNRWHLGEVFVRIDGELRYLGGPSARAATYSTSSSSTGGTKTAARHFSRRLVRKRRAVPRVVVTDGLRSQGAAHREVMPSVGHRQPKHPNNRAENSHQPTRTA
ncbi:DDE-type integrase/transposase/recombinase [Streptomyces sp. NPDC003016]